MADKSFRNNLTEILLIAKAYINARIELWKLTLLEKSSLAGAFFISTVVLVLIIAFCLLFLSLAFAHWYGQVTGDLATGFLITAGFYVVVGIIFVLTRKYTITGPVIKNLASIIYEDDEPEEETAKDE